MAVRFSSRDDKVDGKVQVDDHEAERKPLVGQKESVNSYYSTINGKFVRISVVIDPLECR